MLTCRKKKSVNDYPMLPSEANDLHSYGSM